MMDRLDNAVDKKSMKLVAWPTEIYRNDYGDEPTEKGPARTARTSFERVRVYQQSASDSCRSGPQVCGSESPVYSIQYILSNVYYIHGTNKVSTIHPQSIPLSCHRHVINVELHFATLHHDHFFDIFHGFQKK
jgi:hypothetical protein